MPPFQPSSLWLCLHSRAVACRCVLQLYQKTRDRNGTVTSSLKSRIEVDCRNGKSIVTSSRAISEKNKDCRGERDMEHGAMQSTRRLRSASSPGLRNPENRKISKRHLAATTHKKVYRLFGLPWYYSRCHHFSYYCSLCTVLSFLHAIRW